MLKMLVLIIAAVLGASANAQDFPTRPITLVVPFPPAAATMRWRASSPSA